MSLTQPCGPGRQLYGLTELAGYETKELDRNDNLIWRLGVGVADECLETAAEVCGI